MKASPKIKIGKSMFRQADRIGAGDEWVTQGHWAVRKMEFDAKSQEILRDNVYLGYGMYSCSKNRK